MQTCFLDRNSGFVRLEDHCCRRSEGSAAAVPARHAARCPRPAERHAQGPSRQGRVALRGTGRLRCVLKGAAWSFRSPRLEARVVADWGWPRKMICPQPLRERGRPALYKRDQTTRSGYDAQVCHRIPLLSRPGNMARPRSQRACGRPSILRRKGTEKAQFAAAGVFILPTRTCSSALPRWGFSRLVQGPLEGAAAAAARPRRRSRPRAPLVSSGADWRLRGLVPRARRRPLRPGQVGGGGRPRGKAAVQGRGGERGRFGWEEEGGVRAGGRGPFFWRSHGNPAGGGGSRGTSPPRPYRLRHGERSPPAARPPAAVALQPAGSPPAPPAGAIFSARPGAAAHGALRQPPVRLEAGDPFALQPETGGGGGGGKWHLSRASCAYPGMPPTRAQRGDRPRCHPPAEAPCRRGGGPAPGQQQQLRRCRRWSRGSVGSEGTQSFPRVASCFACSSCKLVSVGGLVTGLR